VQRIVSGLKKLAVANADTGGRGLGAVWDLRIDMSFMTTFTVLGWPRVITGYAWLLINVN